MILQMWQHLNVSCRKRQADGREARRQVQLTPEGSEQPQTSKLKHVGDSAHATAGASVCFFATLGDSKINMLAISQGSSEMSVSAVVAIEERAKALNTARATFRLSHAVARVIVSGMDNELGRALLELLEKRGDTS